ncbi:MAG: aspartate carbamoyltransferase [Gammaproteobacteria bacterium]|jgi:aspartate carbamoyltransferase catalytic subunit
MKDKLKSYLSQPVTDEPLDVRGFDRPRMLIETVGEDLVPLLDLAHRPVVSARQYSRDQLLQLCRLAARYETQPQLISRPLTGKILVSAFYEPSTRTRLSFESAWHRLGGDIMSITDPATTGIAKGESLYDVGEMLNHYGDLVVLRDSANEAIYEMLEALRIPIVNAGNGIDEHPTQGMADIYALLKWRPALAHPETLPAAERVRIGIVGVPGRMRTVRSLLYFLTHFAAAIEEVVIVTDSDDPFAEGQLEELQRARLRLRVARELDAELPSIDVVYINAIAWVGDSYEAHGARYRLDAGSPLKPGAIVLHPLARGVELDRSLDATSHNWYFAQARGAVFVRMALLAAILKIYN